MSKTITHRLLAIVDNWSYSHCVELGQDEWDGQFPKDAPSYHSIVLSGEFGSEPTADEVGRALAVTEVTTKWADGAARMRSYAIVDGAGWREIAGDAAERIELDALDADSPEVARIDDPDNAPAALGEIQSVPSLPRVSPDWEPMFMSRTRTIENGR